MIKLTNIFFAYPDKPVLKDINLSIERGESISVIGASGSGKSTLLRILSGILPTQSNEKLKGELLIDDKVPGEYVKSGQLSLMFQDPSLIPHMTVKENIGFPLKIRGEKQPLLVEELIQKIGLEKDADLLPKELSGGMKTRVALARSFVTNPDLLLLDEPFSALDVGLQLKLYKELEQLRNEYKTTVILVTHDIEEALLLSDRIAVLGKDGKLIKVESIDTDYSIFQRLYKKGEYLESVYNSYLVPLEELLIRDELRHVTTKKEALRIIELVREAAGDPQKEERIIDERIIEEIRFFTGTKEFHKILKDAYRNSETNKFKYKLFWDLLNYPEVEQSLIDEIYSMYGRQFQEFSKLSLDYYKQTPDSIFDHLKQIRLGDKNIPASKSWIYLCVLASSNEKSKVDTYLREVIDGQHSNFNNDFAIKVAKELKGGSR